MHAQPPLMLPLLLHWLQVRARSCQRQRHQWNLLSLSKFMDGMPLVLARHW
jgi:hypothetical protein